jgi:hypothetical protein
MGKQALLHQRQAGEINVVTPSLPGRLSDPILQPHDRPATVDDDRAVAAKAAQGRRIQDIELYRGDSAIEGRCERLPPG